jgi:isopentenyl-diphosphate delta-isomerase
MTQTTKSPEVMLVNQDGEFIALKEKMQAHVDGDLHLAFSVQIVRYNKGQYELLLQQRALSKYHSGGLWANTCCSHPALGESFAVAAKRRLFEELAIHIEESVQDIGQFIYKARLDNDLYEHELDHVLIIESEVSSIPGNPDEVMATQWYSIEQVKTELTSQPEKFCIWFPHVFTLVQKHLENK